MAAYMGLEVAVVPTDSEHRGYFVAAKAGQLVVQRCLLCGLLRGSIGAACPFCTSGDWEWHQVSGRGTIYSYGIVSQAIQPAFRAWVPYPIVLVELDEQRGVPWHGAGEGERVSLRVVANLVTAEDPGKPVDEAEVAIGKRVEVCFVDLDESMALPQFRLSREPPEEPPWRAPG